MTFFHEGDTVRGVFWGREKTGTVLTVGRGTLVVRWDSGRVGWCYPASVERVTTTPEE